MTPAELRAHCHQQMEILDGIKEAGDVRVLLILPGRWRSDFRRLAGRSGPMGRVVSEVERGVLVDFKAREILAWLDKHDPTPTPEKASEA